MKIKFIIFLFFNWNLTKPQFAIKQKNNRIKENDWIKRKETNSPGVFCSLVSYFSTLKYEKLDFLLRIKVIPS
jgi:hypothetical protein